MSGEQWRVEDEQPVEKQEAGAVSERTATSPPPAFHTSTEQWRTEDEGDPNDPNAFHAIGYDTEERFVPVALTYVWEKAEQIVSEHNSHAALVQALDKLLALIDKGDLVVPSGLMPVGFPQGVVDFAKQVRAAAGASASAERAREGN